MPHGKWTIDMYLHIGNDKLVRGKEILGIFDLDTASVSPITKKFLAQAERESRTQTAKDELPKAFVVTTDGNVVFSQISSGNLVGRLSKPHNSGATAFPELD